ncbi:MAG: hypothetical protein WAM73_14285 [Desulfobacterales bacterium]
MDETGEEDFTSKGSWAGFDGKEAHEPSNTDCNTKKQYNLLFSMTKYVYLADKIRIYLRSKSLITQS